MRTELRSCPLCGAEISAIVKACPFCLRVIPAANDDEISRKDVIVRTYSGQRKQIVAKFEWDAPRMAELGYRVESQQYVPGKRGGCLLLSGILTLGLLFLAVRPTDSMIVTYRMAVREVGPVVSSQ